ncbi:MAG TPA: helix-turn-helix domain-containing protein [Nitrospiraceae bacterium]
MEQGTLPIALRLADEGVPLRAIARAVATPSAEIYAVLIEARRDGRIVNLPRDDWPPGCPRDQRALQLSRLAAADPAMLLVTIQEIFLITRTPARLLLRLTQHDLVPREGTDVSPNCLDVHICKLRNQLRPLKLRILTLWGQGYRLPLADRQRIMEMILAKIVPSPA